VVLKPPTQLSHRRSLVVLPGALADTLCPSLQLLQATHAVAGFMSPSQVPGCGQVAPVLGPPGQYQPATQSTHVGDMVGVPGAVWR
jgi:hypothetical protein